MRAPGTFALGVGDALLRRGSEGRVMLGRADEAQIPAGESHLHRAGEIAGDLAAAHPTAKVFGAIGFDGDEPGCLWVPEAQAEWEPQGAYLRAYGSDEDLASTAEEASLTFEDPDRELLRAAIEDALASIASGELTKVVLARRLIATASAPFDPQIIAAALHRADPSSLTYSVGWGEGTVVGSTPELLVRCRDGVALTEAVAGSAPRRSEAEADEASARALMASEKDREEHRIVVDDIRSALEPHCRAVNVAPRPQLRKTSRVWHLVTPIEAVLEAEVTSLRLAAALHPTSSICGVPRKLAMETIREREPFARGLYCGTVGWTNNTGDGEWAVALRCAYVEGASATLYAGSGIVSGSEPEAELAETDSKMEVFLSAIQ